MAGRADAARVARRCRRVRPLPTRYQRPLARSQAKHTANHQYDSPTSRAFGAKGTWSERAFFAPRHIHGSTRPGQSRPTLSRRCLPIMQRFLSSVTSVLASASRLSLGQRDCGGIRIGIFLLVRAEHSIDYQKPEVHLLARSQDGSETWAIEEPASLQPSVGLGHRGLAILRSYDRGQNVGTGRSQCRISGTGESSRIPGFPSSRAASSRWIVARTDYLINGPHDCTVLLTAAKPNGQEGRVARPGS